MQVSGVRSWRIRGFLLQQGAYLFDIAPPNRYVWPRSPVLIGTALLAIFYLVTAQKTVRRRLLVMSSAAVALCDKPEVC